MQAKFINFRSEQTIKISQTICLWLVFITLSLQSAVADCEYDQKYPRVALVIGNTQYQSIGVLPNAENDANDIARVLKAYEFAVIKRLNISHEQMRETVDCFSRTLLKGGVGLLYYAGHGVQLTDRNYLLPIDFSFNQKSQEKRHPANEVKQTALDANHVLRLLERAKTKNNIIILDACRNNPFRSNQRNLMPSTKKREILQLSSKDGLAPMSAPPGSFIAFATEPGNTSSDGAGSNGLFTEKLLKFLKMPMLEITQVFNRTRAEVVRVSGKKQVPWTRSSLLSSFYFSALVRDIDKKQHNSEYQSALLRDNQPVHQRELTLTTSSFDYNQREFNKNFQRGKKYLHSKGRADKAITYFKMALRFDTENADAFYQLGLANMELNNYPEAIYSFKKTIKKSDGYFLAYEKLAECYDQLGDSENAVYFKAKANEGILLNYQE